MNALYMVLPGDVDDVTSPSGGNVYDRVMIDELGQTEHPIRLGYTQQ